MMRMYHRLKPILLAIMLLTGGISAWGQSTSFSYSDSLTYRQYLDGNWEALLRSGKLALKSGNDYKYLRMRMGIAYYELKDYRHAAEQFTRAHRFDTSDTLAAWYYNLACQSAGRPADHIRISGMKRPYAVLESFSAEAGMMIRAASADSAAFTDSLLLYRDLTHPLSRKTYSLGLSANPAASLNIYLGFSQYLLRDQKSFAYLT
jgi:tetratricopeptide (TPR) repeat protein